MAGWGVAVGCAGLAHQLWLMVVLLAVGGAAELVGGTASWAGGGFGAAALMLVLALVFPALVRYTPPPASGSEAKR